MVCGAVILVGMLLATIFLEPSCLLLVGVGLLVLSVGVGMRTAAKREGRGAWLGLLTGSLTFIIPLAIFYGGLLLLFSLMPRC